MKKPCVYCKIRKIWGTEKYSCSKCLKVYFQDDSFLDYVVQLETKLQQLMGKIRSLLR